ncbi:MAG: hypothetical protein C0490_21845 [Marivirga sp.]|nr:hypothetical protein [Marivirga sp.]
MTLEIFFRIALIHGVLSTLFVVLALVFFRRTGLETKVLILAFVFGPVAYLSMGALNLKGKQVNIPQSIDAIIYFCALTVVYYHALGKRYTKSFLTIGILFVVVALINLLFIQKMDNNTYTKVIRSIILISYCVFYCYRLMVDLPVQHLHRVPMFWYNSGILIFNAGTLFLFLFTNYLVEVLHNDLLIYWTLHNILHIIQTLVIIFGLWMDLRNSNVPSSSPSVP